MLRVALSLLAIALSTITARGQPRFGAPSCLGQCNNVKPSFLQRLSLGCSCSSFCETNKPKPNCCEDYWTHCSKSCKTRCGKGFHPLFPCQCFEGCTGDSCCEDYKEVCVDGLSRSLSSPPPPTTMPPTTTPKPRPIEIGYSFIAGKEVTCPKGVAFVSCPFNPCNQACELFPNAKCEVNQCGTCEAKYTDSNNQTVDCFEPDEYCANGQRRRFECGNTDLCIGTSCPAFPRAQCVPNNCGGCHYDFVDEVGAVVDCELGTRDNICQEDCVDDPCQSARCEAHPSVKCVSKKTDLCGICVPSFVQNGVELTDTDCDIATERSLFDGGPSKCSNGKTKGKCDGMNCLSAQCQGHSLAICVEDPCDACKARFYDIALRELTCQPAAEETTATSATVTTMPADANNTTASIVAELTPDDADNTTASIVAELTPDDADTTTPIVKPTVGGSRSLTCPNGELLQSCDHETSCESATCGAFQTAICKANPCDGCKPMFFNEFGERINCDQNLSGGTCLGRCGMDVENATCQCTNDCRRENNCCSDFKEICLPQKTCKDKCGSPYAPNDICQCNERCIEKSDCCLDYDNDCA